jgi:hypothetical protein
MQRYDYMKTSVPDDIDNFLRDKSACGDYHPVDNETGPVSGPEWLALAEDEAEVQLDVGHLDKRDGDLQTVMVRERFAQRLKKFAAALRKEGFKPVKFHWELP